MDRRTALILTSTALLGLAVTLPTGDASRGETARW